MNDFIFQCPTKVYFGREQLAHLPEEVQRFGERVLLVYGGGSIKRSGLYDRVLGLLETAGLTVFELSGVTPNPRHTLVNEGAQLCRREGIDVVLAVGGGSVIDCSKGIAATALAQTDDVWTLVEGRETVTAALPVVAIPTMAAAGSEMDWSGVLSNEARHLKMSLRSTLLIPRVTFANPENTFSVSAYQTACGSIDIMSHVMDASYFSQQSQLDMVQRMQEELFKTVIRFAPVALAKPDDYDARANLLWAAAWAVNGFLVSGVRQGGACHAMEHELSAYYDITHGHGIAIVLPRWLSYCLNEATAPRIYRFGQTCLGVAGGLSTMEGAQQSIAALSAFCFETMGLESHLSALGIGEEHVEDMAAHACANGPINSFITLDKDDLVAIYRMCL